MAKDKKEKKKKEEKERDEAEGKIYFFLPLPAFWLRTQTAKTEEKSRARKSSSRSARSGTPCSARARNAGGARQTVDGRNNEESDPGSRVEESAPDAGAV